MNGVLYVDREREIWANSRWGTPNVFIYIYLLYYYNEAASILCEKVNKLFDCNLFRFRVEHKFIVRLLFASNIIEHSKFLAHRIVMQTMYFQYIPIHMYNIHKIYIHILYIKYPAWYQIKLLENRFKLTRLVALQI